MIKLLISMIFLVSVSQAGMFDSMVNSVTDEAKSSLLGDSTKSIGIVSSITDSLDVTPTQASGGTAILMQYAKSKVSGNDFTKLTDNVPGLDSLDSGSILGKVTGAIDTVEQVKSKFKSLGLDAEMIKKFVPIIKNFAGKTGGDESESIVSKAFSTLM